ncbi:glycerophosphodiester phosphodiesterase [Actinomadura kijaniata]|uniref:glycerophosphodiester phosphodiesterase n=1 Tax=Actinomadura kijaniata TaxID=46161 RepID=UPI000837A5B1|nr:glycerophosphodiester phosphodiesterase [Actinomadura kijaniata]
MIFNAPPAVVGHRGSGSGDVTTPDGATVAENTLPSIFAALEAGADWVEIDVTRTADDDLVLRHDPTGADGGFLVEATAAASGLPRLVEVFDALPPGVPVDVDVKTVLEDAVDAPARRTGALLAPVLRREAARRPLLVTSFDPSLLTFLREEVPEVPVGLLTWLRFPLWHGVPAAAGLGFQAVGVHTASCGFEQPDTRLRPLDHVVDVAHKADLEVLVWCPKPEAAVDYAKAGVDALVVNDVPGTAAALTG